MEGVDLDIMKEIQEKYPTDVGSKNSDDVLKDWMDKEIDSALYKKMLNRYSKLNNMNVLEGQHYFTYLNMLNKEVEDGNHGSFIILGVHSSKKKAKKYSQKLISKYKLDNVRISSVGKWEYLLEKLHSRYYDFFTPDNPETKLSDEFTNNQIKNYNEQEYQDNISGIQEHHRISKQLENVRLKSEEVKTIEHYTYSWHTAIQEHNQIIKLKAQLNKHEDIYNEAISKIRVDQQAHPEFEHKWLSEYANTHSGTNSSITLARLTQGYQDLKSEILGSITTD